MTLTVNTIEVRELAEKTLETNRLILEALRRSHAEELFDVLADERLFRFIPADPPASVESLAQRFEQLERRGPPGGKELWLNWVMRLKSDGSCVGRVEATVLPDRTALLAYELGAAHWGRGLATEACREATHALFLYFRVEQIVADVDTRNAASLRLLERLGFERGPVTRGADHFKGAVSDELRWTLPRPASFDAFHRRG